MCAFEHLTNARRGQTQSYTFDPMGNRPSRQDSAAGATNYGYNAAIMLTGSTGAGGSSYSNDLDGDTLTGGGRAETWDSQNRMTACTLGGATSTFTYGADGLRRGMTAGGQTTNYAYDGQTMTREMNAALVKTATYLTGPRGPEYRRDDTQTEPDGQGHTYGKTRWYVYDGLGSVVGEVDPAGNVTASDRYDVYGAVRGRTGTASTAHGFVGSLGHLSDAATGLVYMRARYYDPGTGRFASQDPGISGNNWFVYSSDNPVNNVDQDGKSVLTIGLEIGAIDVACWNSNFFCGTFLAACCFLLLPELPLLAGAVTGSLAQADDMALALLVGISSSYNMAVKGGQEVATKGRVGIFQEIVGFAIGYAALIMLTSDFMDAVDNG